MKQWPILLTAILSSCSNGFLGFRTEDRPVIEPWSIRTSCLVAHVGTWKASKNAETAASFFHDVPPSNECLLVMGWQGSTRFFFISPVTLDRPDEIGSFNHQLIEAGIGYVGRSLWLLGGEPRFKTFGRSVQNDGKVTGVFTSQDGRCFKKPGFGPAIDKAEVDPIQCKPSSALKSWIAFLIENGYLTE